MKDMKNWLVTFTMIAGFLLASTAAKADPLTITLSSPYQVGIPGDVIGFVATVTNISNHTVNLYGDNLNVDAPLSVDDSPYGSWPSTLGSGDSNTALLFNVDIPLSTANGLYSGSFEITGIHGGVVGATDFDVQVTPEPGSLLLFGTGLLGFGLAVLGGSFRRVIT